MKISQSYTHWLILLLITILTSATSKAETFKTTSVRFKDSAPTSEIWNFDVEYESKNISWTDNSGHKHYLVVDTVYSSVLSSKTNRYTFEGSENNVSKKIEVDIPTKREGKRVTIRLKEGDKSRTFDTDVYSVSNSWTWFWFVCVLIIGLAYYVWGLKKYNVTKSRYRLNAAPAYSHPLVFWARSFLYVFHCGILMQKLLR